MSIRVLAKSLFWICCALVAWGTLSAPSGGVVGFLIRTRSCILVPLPRWLVLAYRAIQNARELGCWWVWWFRRRHRNYSNLYPMRSAEVADFLADIVGITMWASRLHASVMLIMDD